MEVDVQNVKEGNVYFCPVCNRIVQDDVKSYKAQSVQCGKCQLCTCDKIIVEKH